ncbi:MAG: hypothetical protein QOJ20_3117 [Mycobacterium sp.]|jgi:hypothetical protein|nr:hypothetical protein [Mycobacterium sp.]
MSLQGANSGIGLVSDRLVLREFPHRPGVARFLERAATGR